jgi:hypothetical protein
MRVFIVFGQTGEYSDRTDWPVKGFLSRERAEAFEMDATKWAKKYKADLADVQCDECYGCGRHNFGCRQEPKPPHDPGFRCDYTGTDYYTIEVEVES